MRVTEAILCTAERRVYLPGVAGFGKERGKLELDTRCVKVRQGSHGEHMASAIWDMFCRGGPQIAAHQSDPMRS